MITIQLSGVDRLNKALSEMAIGMEQFQAAVESYCDAERRLVLSIGERIFLPTPVDKPTPMTQERIDQAFGLGPNETGVKIRHDLRLAAILRKVNPKL